MLRPFTSLKRVAKCGVVRSGGAEHVHIKVRPNGRAHFANLQTCGSVHACPSCSEKILAERANDIQAAIRNHWRSGGSVILGTLTMRHNRGQLLSDLWDALSPAWAAACGGSTGTRALWEPLDWVCRRDVTHGENGWHLHVHALIFVPAGVSVDVEQLRLASFSAWSAALQRRKLDAPELGPGAHFKRLSLAGMRSEVASYLAKGTYSGAEKLNARDAALEIASSAKRGRAGNRTPFQILDSFVKDGLHEDGELWREWEQASHGRRVITWSKGTRERLVGDEEEREDQEVVEASDGAGVVVAVIDRDAWPVIVARPELQQRLLAVVELLADPTDAFVLLSALLEREGLYGCVGPPGVVSDFAA